MRQVLLQLREDGRPHKVKKFTRISKILSGEVILLKFIIPAAFLNDIFLCTNIPFHDEATNTRKLNSYRRIPFELVHSNGEPCLVCTVSLLQPGTFAYYTESSRHTIFEKGTEEHHLGFIQIPPTFQLENHFFGPELISLQTNVTKFLGPLSRWHEKLQFTSQCGYNMIHFTPPQQRGISNSPYSLYSHLNLSDDLFDGSESAKDKISLLAKSVKEIQKKLGLLSMVDIVWNHASCDAPWFKDHPEAGYTVENTPHLRKAYELDEAIIAFSRSISNTTLATIENFHSIDKLLDAFEKTELSKVRLWEYYIMDVDDGLAELAKFIAENTLENHGNENLEFSDCFIDDGQFNRFSLKPHVSNLVAYHRKISNAKALNMDEFKRILERFNTQRFQIYERSIRYAIDNIKRQVQYERLDPCGPRLGPINDLYSLT